MRGKALAAGGLILALAGCAGLQFSEVSPRIGDMHPKSVAILPFTNSMGLENANDETNSQLLTSLQKSGRFERLVDPGQVKAQMASNDALLTSITNYRSKWVATGMSDKSLMTSICKSLNCDSVAFGEITQWGEQSSGLQKTYRAGLALRWVDQSGEILWKVAHNREDSAGILAGAVGLAGVKNTMKSVVAQVVKAWPKG